MLTTEQLKTMFSQMAAFGIQRIGIWGGEPLLRADILEVLSFARNLGMYVTIDTNGYLVPQKPDIVNCVDHIIVSLDGPQQSHDANREPGSFEKAMAAVELISRSKTPLWTITVLTKNNLDKIDWILDKADEYNFTPTFQVLHHSSCFGVNDPLMPSDDEYRQCLLHLKEAKGKGRRMGNSMSCIEHLLNWKSFFENTSENPGAGWNRCWAGKFYVNVDADGRLFPCSLLIDDEKDAPSVVKLGFDKAWQTMASEALPCQSCSATCFTEYNLLFSLNHRTILQWVMAMGSRLRPAKQN